MGADDISIPRLALTYAMLIVPIGIILWYKVPTLGSTISAVLRMTVQLLFVGLYLQIVFEKDNIWLTLAWLFIMLIVANVSIIRDCGLKLKIFILPIFISMALGTLSPLFFFIGVILNQPHILNPQYVIPIGGMILGNCLEANIIGLKAFYHTIRKDEKAYLHMLANGASLSEATKPYLRTSFQNALAPRIAVIGTTGLVALPGMMTGVILAGTNPITAIKYQLSIMFAILTGAAITVILGILMTRKTSFTRYGILNKSIFSK
ncbi:MAG: ABC transporter permease [Armatimonadota bacterium]